MVEDAPTPTVRGASSSVSTGSNHHMSLESSNIPPWVEFILAQMDKRFDNQDAKLERLVTRDAFREEQSRVNDLIRELQKDSAKNASDISSEATARMNAEVAQSTRERDEAQRQQATERQTRWQWFAIPAAAVAAYLVPWIANGGLGQQ